MHWCLQNEECDPRGTRLVKVKAASIEVFVVEVGIGKVGTAIRVEIRSWLFVVVFVFISLISNGESDDNHHDGVGQYLGRV